MRMRFSSVDVVVLSMLVAGLAVASGLTVRAQNATPSPATVWTMPEIGALPRDARGMLILEGRDLITATYSHIGPDMPDPAQRFAG